MVDISPSYLLLVHSCVASSLLFAIYSYQTTHQDTEVPLVFAGFSFFIFNIAWAIAIIDILVSSEVICSICTWITAFGISITIIFIPLGTFLSAYQIPIKLQSGILSKLRKFRWFKIK